jgi:histidine triad (HIT) family protein
MTTVFGKIISGEIPCEKLYEDDKMIAIKDLYPKAPIHILIIPKKEYKDLQSLPKEDVGIVGEVVLVAQKLAKEFKIEDNYRFLTNNGTGAGQSIFHLHFHLMGGRTLGEMG